jgi:hypothetical protein
VRRALQHRAAGAHAHAHARVSQSASAGPGAKQSKTRSEKRIIACLAFTQKLLVRSCGSSTGNTGTDSAWKPPPVAWQQNSSVAPSHTADAPPLLFRQSAAPACGGCASAQHVASASATQRITAAARAMAALTRQGAQQQMTKATARVRETMR